MSYFASTSRPYMKNKAPTFSILLPPFSSLWLIITSFINLASSDPQTGFIRSYCNDRYDATDLPAFYTNVNATFADIRSSLSPTTHFATAARPQSTEPIYGIFQCRAYLSYADCLACFDTVSSLALRNCRIKRGSTTFADGCFLRYDYANVFAIIMNPGQAAFCDDPSEAEAGQGFAAAAASALKDVVELVQRADGLFAVGRKVVNGGEGGAAVYAVGQCMLTIGRDGCSTCLQMALNNVEGCLPAAGGRAVEYGCFMRFSGREFFNVSLAVDLDRVTTNSGSSSKMPAIIGASVGAAAFLMSLALVFVWLRRKPKDKEWTWTGNIEGLTELQGPTTFTYSDLKSATRNFDKKNKLGQGGFSTVYKGVLENGKIVAVKKLEVSETIEARSNFESEVTLISNIYHRNLVRLLGCCRRGPNLLLVYEYMEKCSLDKFLYGDKRGTLNWKQRFDIILGTARGLAYLHEEFHVRIIHRDIKPGNILLGDDFKPKVADFGLARLFPENRTHVSTRLAGTLGYAAPEYVLNGQLSAKADMYSFGVVVLETVSGRRSNDITADGVALYLLESAWRLYESESLLDLVDKTLDLNEIKAEEVIKVIEIGLMCTQSAPLRPAMSEVVSLLMRKDYARFHLIRPTFMATNRNSTENSTSTASSTSNANMTLSLFSGR